MTVAARGPGRAVLLLGLYLLASSSLRGGEAPADVLAGLKVSAARLTASTQSASEGLTLTCVRRVERYGEGLEFDTHQVRQEGGKVLGQVVHLQMFTGPGEPLHMAVGQDRSGVTSVELLRPVAIAGRPFPHFPRVASLLKGRPLESTAYALADLFRALEFADEANAGTSAEGAEAAGAVRPRPVLTVVQAELPLGSSLPAIDLPALGGGSAVPAALAGKRLVVVVGPLADSRTGALLRAVSGELESRPEVAQRAILASSEAEVREWASRADSAHTPPESLVPDPDRKAIGAFLPPFEPYLYVFDRRHQLVHKTFWSGVESLHAELSASFEEKSP